VEEKVSGATELSNRMGVVSKLNTVGHRRALVVFMAIVLLHWVEHIAQAIQVYAFGWTTKQAGGFLGLMFPWLVSSEWLHYGYALVMLVGLILLRPGFVGVSRTWWNIALGIQVWHFIEHFLLLIQAQSGLYLLGRPVPTSVIQLFVPRMELHLFYNAIVFIPMIIAVYLHMRPPARDRVLMRCPCAFAAA
jgi:hypothetical protein